MRNVIYFILLSLLFACSNERKPLEIRPIMAEDVRMGSDGHWERKDYPIPGAYYIKNFENSKDCLTKLLRQIKHSTLNRELYVDLYPQSGGGCFESVEGHVDQKRSFYINRSKKNEGCFEYFRTWSKLWIYEDDFRNKCDYKYKIIRKGKAAVVYFDYDEFDTDTWQKFINVVFYDRKRLWWEDYNKHNLWRDDVVLAWRNWSAPTRYSLLNLQTKEIECVIEYPLADNYEAFTMEIH